MMLVVYRLVQDARGEVRGLFRAGFVARPESRESWILATL